MKTSSLSSLTVICGFPGIGKSYLSRLHPELITNIEIDSFAWITPTVRNPKFPQNYIDAIKQCSGTVLVSSHKDVRECLSRNRINFATCYPKIDCKHSYLERYRRRGSSIEFIRLMDIMWIDWHKQIQGDVCSSKSMVLNANQYLSDVINLT